MRPAYEWISRVNQKHKQLAERDLSARQREILDRWIEIEFVYSTLKLEGADVQREEVTRVVSADARTMTDGDRAALALLETLRTVTSLARETGKAASLTPDLLIKLHNVPGAVPGLRKGSGDAARTAQIMSAESLPIVLETAFRWYTADSFAELHPVEQASIVLLRLLEIQPFEEANQQTALLAASLFTLRSELPPIIIGPEMHAAYRVALDEGGRMNTKPMVELVAEAAERSLRTMIEEAEGQKEKGKRKN